MNINHAQTQNDQNGIGYCSHTFSDGDRPVVNSYKCHGKKLSAADIWNVQKQRKEAGVRNYGL